VQYYLWSVPCYGAENCTLQDVDQEYLENFKMWCRRRMGKISWADGVKKAVLQWIKWEKNILNSMKRIKDNQLDLSHLAWGLPCKTHWRKARKDREDEEEEVSSYCKMVEVERGGTTRRSHCVENKVCKWLWTCRKKINWWCWLFEWLSFRLRSRTRWKATGLREI